MKIIFRDEYNNTLLEGEDIFIPNSGDLIQIKDEMYDVWYRFIDYDKNIVILRLCDK